MRINIVFQDNSLMSGKVGTHSLSTATARELTRRRPSPSLSMAQLSRIARSRTWTKLAASRAIMTPAMRLPGHGNAVGTLVGRITFLRPAPPTTTPPPTTLRPPPTASKDAGPFPAEDLAADLQTLRPGRRETGDRRPRHACGGGGLWFWGAGRGQETKSLLSTCRFGFGAF